MNVAPCKAGFVAQMRRRRQATGFKKALSTGVQARRPQRQLYLGHDRIFIVIMDVHNGSLLGKTGKKRTLQRVALTALVLETLLQRGWYEWLS